MLPAELRRDLGTPKDAVQTVSFVNFCCRKKSGQDIRQETRVFPDISKDAAFTAGCAARGNMPLYCVFAQFSILTAYLFILPFIFC